MAKRKSLSKKIRFEVFKRDSFTCQYCGRKAPDVILEIDHIEPVSKGGTNDILNLVTSCSDCNRGKSNRELSDNSVLEKQRNELELLNERRNQIDMMLQWKKELLKQEDYELEKLAEYWEEVSGYSLTEYGLEHLKDIYKKYEFSLILEGIEETNKTYSNDPEKALDMLPRVLKNLKNYQTMPYLRDIHLYTSLIRQKCNYFDMKKAVKYLIKVYEIAGLEKIQEIYEETTNWSTFRRECESVIGDEF